MQLNHFICTCSIALLLLSPATRADNLKLEIEIPRLEVAEYHKPYVAVWLEDESRKARQIALWYDLNMRDNEGQQWLKDLRQWWRRGGRQLQLPYDGVTSATRGPGQHSITIPLNHGELVDLSSGAYRLRIEASREVGGRELIELPLNLPLSENRFPLSARGESELGRIVLTLNATH
ncbi:DUF2271 domain-containing protein [Lacimicrobium alkaliphilum]|uniref:DUF2271 domain-containing protein n=1 Tax=Lacimicrobium alkaliphilum TaxID=1526571 RepID=A0ABQ1RJ19_9ALTE|nr:DUF2271 domain-containing protein [Lacimicrobium alkaliphilum]GGD69384.1 hypothetical protein GCM10011357_25560 [Lacimicrobium alkaliphilum]